MSSPVVSLSLPPARAAGAAFVTSWLLAGTPFWTAVVVAVAVARAVGWVNQQYGPRPTAQTRARRASMITDVLLKGSFPPQYAIPESIIHSIMFFDRLPTPDACWAILQKTLFVDPTMERFRSIGTVDSGIGIWQPVDASTLDQSHHLVVEPAVPNEEAILRVVERLLATPLAGDKPMWTIHFIQNTSGRSAVVPRVAHAIGDGMSLVQLFRKIVTDKDGGPCPLPSFLTKAPTTEKKKPAAAATPSGGDGKRAPRPTLLAAIQAKLIGTAKAVLKVVTLPAGPSDSDSAFRDSRRPFKWTGTRTVVLTPNIPLSLIKTIKDGLGATVNDVLVAALAGAIRRYLESRNPSGSFDNIKMRALIPYAFPRELRFPTDTGLRNQWCFLSLALPVEVHPMEARKRLEAAKARCDALKSTPEAYIQFGAQSALSAVLPFSQQAATALDLMLKHSLVFTNVPGPDVPVYMAGQQILGIQTMVTNIVPQISAISYNGELAVSMVLDETIVTEPAKVAQFFMDELETLAVTSRAQ